MTSSASGRFITFEGGEGGGKSTQARRLAERLETLGETVLLTREPGGTPAAEAIRGLLVNGAVDRWQPMTEALLHTAARVEHVEQRIRPALRDGIWVICDRFTDSTRVYQGLCQGLGLDAIDRLQALAIGTLAPDLTLVLDLPVEAALPRLRDRAGGEDRYERMGRDFHDRLRAGFLDLARAEPARCHVIDATPPVETVSEAVWAAVRNRFGLPS